MVLILPLKWCLSIVFAAVIHEFFHYLAIRVTGNRVPELSVTLRGAVMQTTPLSDRDELLCALAGPLGSLLLFFCYPWIPRIAICAGVQAVFNLLPLYPLDGGRIFRILVHRFFPVHAGSVCQWTEWIWMAILFLSGLYFSVSFHLGSGPIFLSVFLVFKAFLEKFLAKRGN